MPTPCLHLKPNPEAHKLCRFFVHKKHVPIAKMDTGVPYIDFRNIRSIYSKSDPKLSMVKGTRGNKKLEAGEIYKYALKLIEQENALGNNRTPSHKSLSFFLTKLKSFRPPWILNDFNPQTKHDDATILKIKKAISKISGRLISKGYRKNTRTYNTALAKALIAFMVKSKRQGGLGIKPVFIEPNKVKQERNALQAILSQKLRAHCTETMYVLYEIFRLAGLKPEFLLVFRDSTHEISLKHVCVGIRLDPQKPNRTTTIDLTYPIPKLRFNTPHMTTIPMPLNMVMGAFHNNKGSALFNTKLAQKLSLQEKLKMKTAFAKSLAYDKNFPLFQLNMALYYSAHEFNSSKTKKHLDTAIKLYPIYKKLRKR